MSHAAERKEKNCLNCGTTVVGRYCHICGQENLNPKESVWHLVSHFFNDITHFDGKFFTSLKDLLFRPGFLSEQYMLGKRATYLNPVRLYVFTSAVFFLIFFAFLGESGVKISTTINKKTLVEIDRMDSASFAAFTANINKEDHKPAIPMTRDQFQKYKDSVVKVGIQIDGENYASKEEYERDLASGKKKDGWFLRQLIYKQIEINQKYNKDPQQIMNAIKHALIHKLPQMLFVSLPVLALILKILYIRRRQFFYVSHAIFSIHLYVFLFIGLLILFSLSKMNEGFHSGIFNTLSNILVISLFVYEFLALKNFYGQGWIKTFFKFLLLDISFIIMLGILYVLFAGFSFFNI